MIFTPHIALDTAMACRVFRGIKLGYISETVAPKATPLHFGQIFTTPTSSSGNYDGMADDFKHTRNHIVVKMTKEMEYGEPTGHEA
jgi:hypothetical protein